MKKMIAMCALMMSAGAFAEEACKEACDKVIKDGTKMCKQQKGDVVAKCLDGVKKMEKTCVEECRKSQ